MKDRIFKNWTFRRALYLLMGVVVIIQSVTTQQWLGIAFGAYFASMGLFAFGCAGGNCYNQGYTSKSQSTATNEVVYEEIK